ncbi:MAG: LURP-one-related family protein [Candidatus Bathyarchaeota archaeon]|nr:LURP-one-related family protein [Candidatus Termiticorpusculum sp.]
MKQKVFSWRDRFYVKDENGNDCFVVEGELFTWGRKLHVYDTSGNEVAFIRQKVWSWRPRYFVEICGCVACEIVKEFTLLKPVYRLEGSTWCLTGNFLAHEYLLTDGDQQIMHLSKKWFTWGDSYELNITNPHDELLCLCIVLAVDCALAERKRKTN